MGSAATLTAGQTTSLKIEIHESGYAFEIQYDSNTKPSKIDLPTTTIISTDAIAVYDAAYSGGAIVAAGFNGENKFIRTTISDPFGTDDISSLDVEITDPSGATTTVNLSAANEVATSGCSKTYEYLWTTPGQEGDYTIKTIAHEGLENTIADTASTIFTVTFNDFGSPCALEFTDELDVNATNYDANATIYVRLTEADKNDFSGTAETITVTLSNTSGDSESLTLTETGLNTGIFQGNIASSSTVVGATNDNSLYAPMGATISVNYTDPDDVGDICTDAAIINTLAPAVAITKTLINPADTTVLIGDFIQFDLVVSNPGPTTLSTVALSDVFDNACMTYDSASVAPTSTGTGTIDWTNVGPISSGGSVTISVYFTSLTACNPANNNASVSAVDQNSMAVSAGPESAFVIIHNPALTISKTVTSPVGDAYVGDTLTYTITLNNIGSTNITTLPLSDNYPAACMEFITASIAPDASGGGLLLWNNLGTLNASSNTSVTVSFKVIGECTPILNTGDVSFATDDSGNDIPAVQSEASKDIQLPPVALDDLTSTTEGVGVAIDVPNNDSDPNSNLNLMSVSTTGLLQPSNGTTSINGTTGEITYTPTGGFSGTDQFEYAICDNTSPTPLCDTATVTVNIQCLGSLGQNIISGTVFTDADQDGSLGASESGATGIKIYLYEDVNENGGIEGLDNLIDSVNSAGDGTYSFTPTPGSFPIQYLTIINTDGLPTGALMTTENKETAYFTAVGQSDCNNNFGFVADADLSLTKTANLGTVQVGQVIIFTISVSNAGPAQASGVEVTDILPAEFNYTNDDSGGNYNSSTGVWTVGTIPLGSTATINISATANAVSTPTNTAEVTMSGLNDPDSTPNNNQATEDDQASLQVTVDCTLIKAQLNIIKN